MSSPQVLRIRNTFRGQFQNRIVVTEDTFDGGVTAKSVVEEYAVDFLT